MLGEVFEYEAKKNRRGDRIIVTFFDYRFRLVNRCQVDNEDQKKTTANRMRFRSAPCWRSKGASGTTILTAK